ncbi:MAG: M20/M25/M40 family metallo-hydrolase [Trueperaceae bacterium]|nr:M20/M25/M40 family metallo-hydrolase [Trueperaceae bacterium]
MPPHAEVGHRADGAADVGARVAADPAADAAALRTLLLTIAQTPAPTGSEGDRAALVMRLWREAGLDARLDAVGNVVAHVPPSRPGGRAEGQGAARVPTVAVAAHLDSVFGPDVDVSVIQGHERWSGPGIGDNAASLAVLTRYLQTRDLPGRSDRPHLVVAATVGEEGLGDLRGAKHLVAELGRGADAFVAFDGGLGSITDTAVGSARYEARFTAPGGHSWGDYGAASAVHAAGEAIAALRRVRVPTAPRSSLNVGQVWGGTSVNAIAERAGFNLDLRSLDAATLAALEAAALAAVRAAAKAAGAGVELVQVGARQAGRSDNERLVAAARAAYAEVGVTHKTSAASTDANPAMAAGVPAIAFGGYRGGNAHRLDEWLEPASLSAGLAALSSLLARLA